MERLDLLGKNTIVEYNMELQLPPNLTEITNIFHHYKHKASEWANSNEKLIIKDGDKVVAVFDTYDRIVQNDWIRSKIEKYNQLWLPTYALHKAGLFKLYDKRFESTYQGNIPLANEDEKKSEIIDYRKLIGDIGEKAVSRFTNGMLSDDLYDSEKDGLINNHITFEVKTMRLINKKQAFWIEPSQFNKLDNVDLLYFVKIPEKDTEDAVVYLYYDTSVYNIIKFKGKTIREYPLTNCLFQCKLDKKDSKLMLEYSKKISKVERFE